MITASIVVYKNKPEILARTIQSYLESSNNSPLFIIDNSPTDTVRSLCQHPPIEYIFNNENVGFGKGHNRIIQQQLDSKYHLVLNPDIYFDKNVIPELLSFMEDNEDVGLIMPKVLYPDGRLQPLCKMLPTPRQIFSRRVLHRLQNFQQKINFNYEMHFMGYDKITEAPSLSGCFMLIRSDVFKKVGAFDERFFLYFEDTDLSRRIHKHFKTIFYPYVKVYHVHERGQYHDKKLFFQGMKSAVQYFNKWGWFNDAQREEFNQSALTRFKLNGYKWNFNH